MAINKKKADITKIGPQEVVADLLALHKNLDAFQEKLSRKVAKLESRAEKLANKLAKYERMPHPPKKERDEASKMLMELQNEITNVRSLKSALETIGNGMKRYKDSRDALKYAADQFQSISQFEPHRKQFLGTGETSSAMKNSMNKLKEVYAHYRSAIHTGKAAPAAPRTIDAMYESASSAAVNAKQDEVHVANIAKHHEPENRFSNVKDYLRSQMQQENEQQSTFKEDEPQSTVTQPSLKGQSLFAKFDAELKQKVEQVKQQHNTSKDQETNRGTPKGPGGPGGPGKR